MKIRYLILFCLMIFFNTYFARSQTTSQSPSAKTNQPTVSEEFEYTRPEETKPPSYFSLLFKTFIILVLFGGGVYYVFRYISKKQGFLPVSSNIIRLLSTVPVGTNRFIQLIEVGTHYYLIGTSDSGITLIAEITDNESINAIKIKASEVKPETGKISFISFIKDIIAHIPGKEIIKGDKTKLSFLKRQKERLLNLNNHNSHPKKR
ncbi:MAG: flagellar biosynthetic protein FliO [Spirochaetes bacterium]|nr:flagellar biosynthetic protein FliO [Spirochaetota bacterium]